MTGQPIPDLSELQKSVLRQAVAARSPEELERSVNLFKTLAEAEKNLIEAAKARPQLKSEGVRFWTPIVASLISAFALVAALGVQVYNSDKNATLQREANEESEWREMLATLRANPGGSAAAAGSATSTGSNPSGNPLIPVPQLFAVQIKSFLDSPSSKHGPQARALALSMLDAAAEGRIDPRILLPSSLEIDDSSLGQILQIDRRLAQIFFNAQNSVNELDQRIQQEQSPAQQSVPTNQPGHAQPAKTSPLIAQRDVEQSIKDGADAEIKVISQAVAGYLKKANGHVQAADLSYARFWGADWSGIKFRNVNLTATYFDQVQLDGADFSEVAQFNYARFYRTAWWRAARFNPAFLTAIVAVPDAHEFKDGVSYPIPVTRADYDSGLQRLKSAR